MGLTPPTIDVAPLLGTAPAVASETVGQLHRACTETGFFVVAGHGLDRELDAVFAAARSFFDRPQVDKERVPRVERYGFVPHSASAIEAGRASDNTEYLDMGLADDVGVAGGVALPVVPGVDLAGAVRAYQRGALEVGRAILRGLAQALGVDADFFDQRMARPQCRLRFLHYPPVTPAADGALPVPTEPHTDYGLITLLATDGVPGLEVRPLDGSWTPVSPPCTHLVVNLGDMMARWTNDTYRSTPHRVVGPARGDRISIPFFVNPEPTTVVDTIPSCVDRQRPLHYEPVTAGEFLARRIDNSDEPYVDRDSGPVRKVDVG